MPVCLALNTLSSPPQTPPLPVQKPLFLPLPIVNPPPFFTSSSFRLFSTDFLPSERYWHHDRSRRRTEAFLPQGSCPAGSSQVRPDQLRGALQMRRYVCVLDGTGWQRSCTNLSQALIPTVRRWWRSRESSLMSPGIRRMVLLGNTAVCQCPVPREQDTEEN